MIKGIDNVGIAATDLARSIAFYEELGFAKGDDYDVDGVKGCLMTASSASLFLFQSTHPEPQPVERNPMLAGNPPGLDHLSFLVEDVDQTYAELRAKGIEFLGEPADLWGLRFVALKDPDGASLGLLHYPE